MLKAPGHSLLPPKRYLFSLRVIITPRSNTQETSFRCRPVVNGSNNEDDAKLGRQHHTAWCTLGNNTTPLGAPLATMTPRSGDDANIGNDVTPLGARLVTMTPSSEMLGNNTKLIGDSTLGNDATVADDATPLGNNTKLAT